MAGGGSIHSLQHSRRLRRPRMLTSAACRWALKTAPASRDASRRLRSTRRRPLLCRRRRRHRCCHRRFCRRCTLPSAGSPRHSVRSVAPAALHGTAPAPHRMPSTFTATEGPLALPYFRRRDRQARQPTTASRRLCLQWVWVQRHWSSSRSCAASVLVAPEGSVRVPELIQ